MEGEQGRIGDGGGDDERQTCIRLSSVEDGPSAERMLASHSWKVVHVDMTSAGLYVRRVCERCGMGNSSLIIERAHK